MTSQTLRPPQGRPLPRPPPSANSHQTFNQPSQRNPVPLPTTHDINSPSHHPHHYLTPALQSLSHPDQIPQRTANFVKTFSLQETAPLLPFQISPSVAQGEVTCLTHNVRRFTTSTTTVVALSNTREILDSGPHTQQITNNTVLSQIPLTQAPPTIGTAISLPV